MCAAPGLNPCQMVLAGNSLLENCSLSDLQSRVERKSH